MGVWVGVGIWSAPCKHTHMHMHVKHDKHGCLHGGGHLQLLNMQQLLNGSRYFNSV